MVYPAPVLTNRALLTLFFLSGCTSLIYELCFYKLLSYVFGSSTLAVTTVLVAFMGGLALGGRLIGERADRTPRPIALYAWLELGIGAYVLLVPLLLQACAALYLALGVSAEIRDLGHVLLRFALSVSVLITPTLLMGGTLPLLARALVRERAGAERELSRLYGINTLGAASGTLLANYVLLRYLGISGTLCAGALANTYIFAKARRLDAALSAGAQPAVSQVEAERAVAKTAGTLASAPFALTALTAFAVGVVSFVYEVVWTHLLATIVGMSVYAFGLMLATFLLGLALGSLWIARGVRPSTDRRELVAALQLALGGVVLASLPLWDKLPYAFEFAGRLGPGFLLMEATRALVCAAMLLLPCCAIGATFPLLLRGAADDPARLGRRVGALYALNTLGCILGALLTGFFLLERFGSRTLLMLGAIASLAIGLAHVAARREGRARRAGIALAGCVLLAGGVQAAFPSWNLRPLAAGMNVNFNPGAMIYEVLWAKEDAQGGFTTITRERRGLTLRTNGKFQADDHTELEAQQGFALIPLLFVPRYGTALNIGYGSGVTAGVLARFPFRRIEIAELSPAIVEASDRYFRHINFSGSRDRRTSISYNDGRNHLFVSKQAYDLISVEITSIWFAGAASLYSREFYRACRKHLSRGGVLQQWVQLHHISQLDLLVLWNTMHSVFPYVSLWRQGTQGALVATVEPQAVSYAHVKAMNELASAQPVQARMRVPDFFSLVGAQQLEPDAMKAILVELTQKLPAWLAPLAISSDLYPYLEYSTPLGYALPDSAEEENLAWIARYDRHRLPPLTGVPDAGAELRIGSLAAAGAGDCARVLALRRHAPPDPDPVLRTVRLRCAQGGWR